MHRGYTAARYLDRLADARRVVPDLAVSTDIIVGFPGETDDDFAATLDVAAEARFDDAFTFIFSPRPGTEAAEMSDRFVDPAVAGQRFGRLRVVIERGSLAANQRRIGRTEEVLVEGPSKKNPAILAGRTRQHRLVHFSAPHPLRPGAYAAVEVTAAAPHHLTARFVEQTAEARHRIKIPVAAG
jgi:tRNA-2-methylthio-N6-dimethylallyladenosine synthase